MSFLLLWLPFFIKPQRVVADPPSSIEIRVLRRLGTVQIRAEDVPPSEASDAIPNELVKMGDEIRTGKDGGVMLSVDNLSAISVGPDSDFMVKSLKPTEMIFHLEQGSLVSKVKRRLETQQMVFSTPDCDVVVRGTEFAIVKEAGNEPSEVGVFNEGHLDVKTSIGEVHVGPRKETQVTAGSAPSPVQPMKHLLKYRQRMQRVRLQVIRLRKAQLLIRQ
jgi:hypothetical protein